MEKRMTKVEKLVAIEKALEGKTLEGFDVNEFLEKEIESVKKKNARKSVTPTKAQKENEIIKTNILSALADHVDGMTATEVARALNLSSPQKASALLKQLGPEGSNEVTREKVGKSTVFKLV